MIVLGSIVFDCDTQVFIVHVQFQVVTGDGVFEKIRTNLGKGFLEIKLDKFFAGRLAPTLASLHSSLALSLRGLGMRFKNHGEKMFIDVCKGDAGSILIYGPLIDDKKDEKGEDKPYEEDVPPIGSPKLPGILKKSHSLFYF